jgi:hypothetical protein
MLGLGIMNHRATPHALEVAAPGRALPDHPARWRTTSNFGMAESKFGIRAMLVHNKIALSLCAGDAILGIN